MLGFESRGMGRGPLHFKSRSMYGCTPESQSRATSLSGGRMWHQPGEARQHRVDGTLPKSMRPSSFRGSPFEDGWITDSQLPNSIARRTIVTNTHRKRNHSCRYNSNGAQIVIVSNKCNQHESKANSLAEPHYLNCVACRCIS